MILSLAACGKKQENIIDEPAVEDEEPVEEYLTGTARISGVKVFWKEADRGTKISVIGEQNDYYLAQMEGTQFLVDKRFVRLSTEVVPQEKTRYCMGAHDLYDSAYLDGAELVRMTLNDQVTVLDEYNGISYVRFGDVCGYISSAFLSDSKYYEPKTEVPQTEQHTSSGSHSNGGGGGGKKEPIDEPEIVTDPQDGGEIELRVTYSLKGMSLAEMIGKYFITVAKADEGQEATVFSDHVMFFLGITTQGEEIQVIKAEDDIAKVLINGQEGTLPRWAVILDGDEVFKEWIGYAVNGAKIFANDDFSGSVTSLKTNDEVHVIYQIDEDTYLVQSGSVIGYMLSENVKTEKMAVAPMPDVKTEQTPSSKGNAGTSNENWSSGSDANNDSEWTEPVL